MANQVTSSQTQTTTAGPSPEPAISQKAAEAKPYVPQSYIPPVNNAAQLSAAQAVPTSVNTLRQYAPKRTPEMDIQPQPDLKKKSLLGSLANSRKKTDASKDAKQPKAKKQKVKAAKTKVMKEKTKVKKVKAVKAKPAKMKITKDPALKKSLSGLLKRKAKTPKVPSPQLHPSGQPLGQMTQPIAPLGLQPNPAPNVPPFAQPAQTDPVYLTRAERAIQTPKLKRKAKKEVDRRRKDRRKFNREQKSTKPDFGFQSLNKYLRFSYLSLFLLVFVFGGWTYLAKIQGAVIAAGQVAVDGKPKIIQHLDGGIVSSILVTEGDVVVKGQTVLELDATILNANLEAAETNYFENQALISRLQAEKSGQNRIYWAPTLSEKRSNSRVALAMSGQEQLFEARRSSLNGEITQLNQRIAQLRDEDRGVLSEIDFTNSELVLVNEEFGKMTALLQQNLVSRNRVTQLERDKTRLQNSIAKLETRRGSINNAIKEARINIAQVQKQRDEQVLTDLRIAQTQADSFSESLKTIANKTNLVTLQAPASGVIHEMTVSTVGGVIAPGQEIMQIIPERDELVIKAHVLPQDIDQVTIGQDTNVIFSALKQSAAPELDGIVTYISADNLTDPITGSSYFEVDIEVADTELPKLDGQTLIPGMPADIFIQTQERTVFDYLTGPLKDTFKKTMRDG